MGSKMGQRRRRRGRTPPEATKAESSSGPTSVSNARRATGWSPERPWSGLLDGLLERLGLLQEGVRLGVLRAVAAGVGRERVGRVDVVVARARDRRREREARRVVVRDA